MNTTIFIRTLLSGALVGLGAGLLSKYCKDFTIFHAMAYGVIVGILVPIFSLFFEKALMHYKNKKK